MMIVPLCSPTHMDSAFPVLSPPFVIFCLIVAVIMGEVITHYGFDLHLLIREVEHLFHKLTGNFVCHLRRIAVSS